MTLCSHPSRRGKSSLVHSIKVGRDDAMRARRTQDEDSRVMCRSLILWLYHEMSLLLKEQSKQIELGYKRERVDDLREVVDRVSSVASAITERRQGNGGTSH